MGQFAKFTIYSVFDHCLSDFLLRVSRKDVNLKTPKCLPNKWCLRLFNTFLSALSLDHFKSDL